MTMAMTGQFEVDEILYNFTLPIVRRTGVTICTASSHARYLARSSTIRVIFIPQEER